VSCLFQFWITVWLWFTVLFANFAEAMAEGRGKAQAETLRRSKKETMARREDGKGGHENVPGTQLRKGDTVLVNAGEVIPSDGDVVEGVATVDESAITGESAPVIRESGGDRSAVTGGTTVLSDWLRIKITVQPGETFMDRMIALVEGAQRQKTPNEIALNILLAGLTIIFLLAVVTLLPFAIYTVKQGGGQVCDIYSLVALLVCLIPTTIGACFLQSALRNGPSAAAQHTGHERQGRRSRGRRRHAVARQNGNNHSGKSPGRRIYSCSRSDSKRTR